MSTYGHLILNMICSSALISTSLLAQQQLVAPARIAQTQEERQSSERQEQVSRQPLENDDSRDVKRKKEGSTKRKAQQKSVVNQRNRNENRQNVKVGQKRSQHHRSNNVNVGARAERHVVPGNGRTVSRVAVPAVAPSQHVIPGSSQVVSAPSSGFSIGLNFSPGTRIRGQRPMVVRRALPQKIIIDNRSAHCPYITLSPYSVSRKGDLIELDDGSLWCVRNRDRSTVRRWSPDDSVLIETGSFFSWYTYTLVNYTRNESVDVELSLEQEWGGRSSHWIVEVNPMGGYVRLEDGSIWRMSSSELSQWYINDDVIIAVTKDWFSNQYSYVLINPRAKNRIIAWFSF